jgi:hypothetical protein
MESPWKEIHSKDFFLCLVKFANYNACTKLVGISSALWPLLFGLQQASRYTVKVDAQLGRAGEPRVESGADGACPNASSKLVQICAGRSHQLSN